jgi:hypothetical protein
MRSFVIASLLLATSACSSSIPQTSALPLKRLRVYETGVGYFERSGTLSADEHAGLPVPTGHLDDALKTLVVLSEGGRAQNAGVEFGSSLSRGMARAMAGLPTDDNATAVDYETLLRSLAGSRVELKTPKRSLTGRLVDVETVKDDKEKEKSSTHVRVTVLTDKAEVVHVDGSDIESVRPTDPAQAARIDAALEALLAHGAANKRVLDFLGKPGAPITLGYIAETPVWRTTYRLVIGSDHKATLQAWALLHNDTDEAWRDVKVELASGRPDSFLFPLAAPRYARRELVTPKNELATVPQLMSKTPDAIWGDHNGESDSYGAGGMGLTGTGEGGGGRGEGIGLGSIGTIGHGMGSGGASSLLEVGDLAQVQQATGVEAGALFVYSMPAPVQLRAHASALVPFMQQSVRADPIAWFESPSASARAAVKVVNSTNQTLPPGTIAFFGDGGFSGESAIDRMRPNEQRFLTFGADLDAIASQEILHTDERVERLSFAHDALQVHFRKTTDSKWTLENRSGTPRTMVIALGIARNATFTGADSIDWDAEHGQAVVSFAVDPRKSIEKKTTSVEGLSRVYTLGNVDEKLLASFVAISTLEPADKTIASESIAKAKDITDVQTKTKAARDELATLEKDLARLREDAKAIGDRGALAQPLVTRIVAAEDRLGVVRTHISDLEKDEKLKFEALRTSLSRLPK